MKLIDEEHELLSICNMVTYHMHVNRLLLVVNYLLQIAVKVLRRDSCDEQELCLVWFYTRVTTII